MNVNVLIDAIVRQTTVLIAQLATSAGARAPLSQTANLVFMDLVAELKNQGLTHNLIADMFGLSLRTYHNKIQRLSESTTQQGESLWSAVLGFIQERGTVARGDVMVHFHRDDQTTVKSVLNDLVKTGMVFSKGSHEAVAYRAASPAEYDLAGGTEQAQALANLIWISIARHSPIRRSELVELVPMQSEQLDEALTRLIGERRIDIHHEDSDPVYSSPQCVIAVGASAGWEASIFDHYQAMVSAMCSKLRGGATRSREGESTGGSTYGYDVWRGHPLHDEVVGFLEATRQRARELRDRVDRHNEMATCSDDERRRVIFYVGQTVIDGDESRGEERA